MSSEVIYNPYTPMRKHYQLWYDIYFKDIKQHVNRTEINSVFCRTLPQQLESGHHIYTNVMNDKMRLFNCRLVRSVLTDMGEPERRSQIEYL